MSKWTYVTGCLHIETFEEEKDIKGYVEKLLEKAPKITGSEENCDIFVNPLSGYNSWVGIDCNHCQYKNTIKQISENSFDCGKSEQYKCPEAEYQTCVVITIVGCLRDREVSRTKEEVEKFVRYIQSLGEGFDIISCSIRVEDMFEDGYNLRMKFLDGDNIIDKGEFVWNKI